MKKKKKIMARIMASIALIAILLWVLGTGILFIIGSRSPSSEQEVSPQQLQNLIESFSGTTEYTP